jgi:hypothetical protein
LSIQVGIDSIDGLDEFRERLGDSSQIRRRMHEVLEEASRIGAQSARIYAPKDKALLVNAIKDDSVQFTMSDGTVEARFGVSPVDRSTRGEGGRFTGSKAGSRRYPIYVHEGTGLYGHLKRVITPKRASPMVFLGRTGWVRTKSVRGQRPQPFMRHGYEDARAYIAAHLDDFANRLFE